MGEIDKIKTDILQLDRHQWTLGKEDTKMYYDVEGTFGNGYMEVIIKVPGQITHNINGFLDKDSRYKITIEKIPG